MEQVQAPQVKSVKIKQQQYTDPEQDGWGYGGKEYRPKYTHRSDNRGRSGNFSYPKSYQQAPLHKIPKYPSALKGDHKGGMEKWFSERNYPRVSLSKFPLMDEESLNDINKMNEKEKYYTILHNEKNKIPLGLVGRAEIFTSKDVGIRKDLRYQNDIDAIYVSRIKGRDLAAIKEYNSFYKYVFRAGVIPYYKNINGTIYFGLNMDSTKEWDNVLSYDLADWGGGVEQGESAAMAAIREWYEETGGIFPRYFVNTDSIVTYYYGFATFFVDVTDTLDDIILSQIETTIGKMYEKGMKKYREALSKNPKANRSEYLPESKGILWLTYKEIINKIQSGDVWISIAPNIVAVERVLNKL